MKEKIYANNLFNLGFVQVISSPHEGVIRGVFLANHLTITDNLTKITNIYEHIVNMTMQKVSILRDDTQ